MTGINALVIKLGGNDIADEAFLTRFAAVIASLDMPIVLIHGGGKEISALQGRLGLQPRYVEGVRVTDPDSLALVTMVLCGLVNKRVVRHLLNGDVRALGLSGVDGGIVRAVPMRHPEHDMGLTGVPDRVDETILLDLLQTGYTPVLAPLCLGEDSILNVNADHVAGAIAASLQAERVVFLSNVPGVLVDGELQASLTHEQALALIEDGTISGGMIPKVRTALSALERGVQRAVITDLDGLADHSGTIFSQT